MSQIEEKETGGPSSIRMLDNLVDIHCHSKNDEEVVEKEVYEISERKPSNLMQPEMPDDDNFLYCEECGKEYGVDCPLHGPLDYVTDTEVYAENDPERAVHTLPPGLVVKESGIEGAGLGVFTEKEIPSCVMFGPYDGEMVYDEAIAHESEYCWQIYANGEPSHFVDAQDKASSNWMRYVNCALSESEQNLVAFQFKGGIYYRSYKTIFPGMELLCWYGNNTYRREVALVGENDLLVSSKIVNGKGCYPCMFCKKSFNTVVHNVRHLLEMHSRDKLSQHDRQVLDDWLMKNDWEEYMQCQQQQSWNIHCDDSFSFVSQQDENGEQISNSEQKVSENECESSIGISMQLTLKGIKWSCTLCDFASSGKKKIEKHMRLHTGEKRFKCGVCDYACEWRSILKKHMRIHSGEKCFKCDICDFASYFSSNLKTHMKVHTGEKSYKCSICNFASYNSGNIKTHMTVHTGEKCFKCNVCDYASNQNSTLKRHMRIHTGEKCFKCDFCDYASNASGNLKTHMRIHTGEKRFKCDMCDFVSRHSGNLKRHMRTHTVEKPYRCDICDYEGKDGGLLKTHMQIHTGENYFKCEVCPYASNRSDNLRTHMRTHAGENCINVGN